MVSPIGKYEKINYIDLGKIITMQIMNYVWFLRKLKCKDLVDKTHCETKEGFKATYEIKPKNN